MNRIIVFTLTLICLSLIYFTGCRKEEITLKNKVYYLNANQLPTRDSQMMIILEDWNNADVLLISFKGKENNDIRLQEPLAKRVHTQIPGYTEYSSTKSKESSD